MKVGDLVRWIGFPGASPPDGRSDVVGVGIIVKVRRIGLEDRYDVSWSDGSLGTRVYAQCLELFYESR
tara:strand:+ start:266 stop:469 length:204 start_codon:yes stop_codon:yes gene_type:complete